ncbi:MAG TPA: NAD(P)-dependent oxidoreductase [Candidatus Nanoarchaeia archaeon]|nr:NAD(P)-dependent oxidoreductase [Candidatus Nanoarchaeia archaeon]
MHCAKEKQCDASLQCTMNNVVILGNKGFIGTHLENYFKSQKISVQGMDMPDVDLTQQNAIEKLSSAFDESSAVVFLSCIKKEHGDTFDIFLKNCAMVANVCEAVEKKKASRIIYFSSAAVYGEEVHNLSINEKTNINPTSYYGLAKFVGERMLTMTAEKNNITLVCMRPPVIYGPGDKPCYGPSGFCSAARQKQQITVWGDGSELREFIYVDDIIQVVSQLLKNNYHGPLNVAQGKSVTFTDIIKTIEKYTGKQDIQFRERTKKKVDNAFDNSLFKQLFSQVQLTPVEKGIQQMLEHK